MRIVSGQTLVFFSYVLAVALFRASDAFTATLPTNPLNALASTKSNAFLMVSPEFADLTTVANHHAEGTSTGGIMSIIQSSMFWSSLIMFSIVGLLYTWEEAVAEARKKLPSTLMPVVDSMLAEMGGLGFIGLFLGVAVVGGPLGPLVGKLSEQFLGEEDILLESFEFLHTAFFEVGIGFFMMAGLTVAEVLKKIESLEEVSSAVFDTDKDGVVTLDELAAVLNVESLPVDTNQDGELSDDEIQQALRDSSRGSILDEVKMDSQQIKAEALVVRERLIRTGKATPDFRIEEYFAQSFGQNLEEIVELSPLTWLPLIPILSLGRTVDLSRDIVSASSANAALSCGCFLSTPSFIIPNAVVVLTCVCWGCFNFWKMAEIKRMLVPPLVQDSSCNSETVMLPPRYEDDVLLADFNSSPSICGWVESFFSKPPQHRHDRLFGTVGAAGPHIYRNSIKFQTWLCVTQILFFGTQIVARDVSALRKGLETGNPDFVLPELALFGFFVALDIGMLWLAPQTFLNFSLVTSIEELAKRDVIDKSTPRYETEGQLAKATSG